MSLGMPGEKLSITRFTIPAWSAWACVAALVVLRGLLKARAPATVDRRVINRFSPGWCGSLGGPVVAIATVVLLDGAVRRWDKVRPSLIGEAGILRGCRGCF
jgi:hypothetical protein